MSVIAHVLDTADNMVCAIRPVRCFGNDRTNALNDAGMEVAMGDPNLSKIQHGYKVRFYMLIDNVLTYRGGFVVDNTRLQLGHDGLTISFAGSGEGGRAKNATGGELDHHYL